MSRPLALIECRCGLYTDCAVRLASDHDGKVSSYEWLASVCNGERRKAYRMFGEADRNGEIGGIERLGRAHSRAHHAMHYSPLQAARYSEESATRNDHLTRRNAARRRWHRRLSGAGYDQDNVGPKHLISLGFRGIHVLQLVIAWSVRPVPRAWTPCVDAVRGGVRGRCLGVRVCRGADPVCECEVYVSRARQKPRARTSQRCGWRVAFRRVVSRVT